MTATRVQTVIDAVLYEGYALYPYRASSIKNRQRWTFGGLHPDNCTAVSDGIERSALSAQCLVEGGPNTLILAAAGFLQTVDRRPAQAIGNDQFQAVPVLDVETRRYVDWQEATERSVDLGPRSLEQLTIEPCSVEFEFAAAREVELLRDGEGRVAGALIRTRDAIAGTALLDSERVGEGLYRVTASVRNTTLPNRDSRSDANQTRAVFLSAHMVLTSTGGQFVSAIDPCEDHRAAAEACKNVGCFPVLVGEPPVRDTLLCSPIILYDYPQIAPESSGDLFDATEIDEILTLRILTMTDAEKREMAGLDDRVARVLARCESLTPEALAQLHGTWRTLRTVPNDAFPTHAASFPSRGPELAFLRIGDRSLRVNDRVRLRPKRSADIMDLALAGKTATIEAIERDFEDIVHVAVTVDDDPGRDFGSERMPGHRFFFRADEIEPLAQSGSAC